MLYRSIQINPGGRLDLADVVGRDREVSRLWEILRRQGVVLSAERRIGKTHILRKLQDACPAGTVTYYQDQEGIYSVRELTDSILQLTATGVRGSIKKAAIGLTKFLPHRIAGTDLPRLDDHWKSLLVDSIEKALSAAKDKQLVVFLWDEFPMMLRNLQQTHGPTVVMELLDVLRSLRQRQSEKLRFLLTGSIGLPLVLRSLPNGNLAPLNDMYTLTVEPLTHAAVVELTTGLLQSLQTPPEEIDTIATAIANQIDGFPYYIHHIVDQLNQLERIPKQSDVSEILNYLIGDDSDPANLHYYRDRLRLYYDDDTRILATKILNILSKTERLLELPEITNLVRHDTATITDESVRATVQLLRDDHYLIPDRGKRFRFRWNIVKRWWRENPL